MRHQSFNIDLSKEEHRVLDLWIRHVATYLYRLKIYAPDYRPFAELEVPGVSVLVASASAAGYLPIAEYEIWKVDRVDRRRRRRGRADLWFVAKDECYSFEFKRAWNVSSANQLRTLMREAVADVADIPKYEFDYAFGGLIAPVFDKDCINSYLNFTEDRPSFWVGDDSGQEVFIYFEKLD